MLILRKEFAEKYPKGKYDSKKFLDFIKPYAKTGNKEIVELLISKGANKYSKNKRGRIPYDLATSDELKSLLK